ncbi:dihydrofolate reductase family protein [Bdellovibrio sp. NC01]|uniref:dihydrofolate reductase family protein n=1 Tax=Bdellovibrio sp. NC01 TaxID=2220073 RepID=UPI00115A410B|nr:dihydrofolate reductase family protein [Bdellovibrio sp. NC01]QDK36392.1 dihydrofolate reductase [Bdellovibrio sp. NC01]
MSKVRVAAFSVSLDGFGAGPHQSLENPLGVRGTELHNWFFKTKVFQSMYGDGNGVEDVDNSFAERSFKNVGAWILGRNMFGPVRGPWLNDEWRGWWGENPSYHAPVFVLTHHKREPLVMEGGTTFYFITDGIESALQKAKEAANGKDVRIGGGVQTVRQYLQAGLIDELHLVYSPIYLGTGESLLAGIDMPKLGFSVTEKVNTENATHVILSKKS